LKIPREQFDDIVQIGSFNIDAPWDQFLAIAVSKLAKVKMISMNLNMITFVFRI